MMKVARILVGLACNFNCSYCCNNIPEVNSKFIGIGIEKAMDIAMDDKYPYINISGGEPLLPCNFNRTTVLITLAKKFNKSVRLYTNGSLLSEAVFDKLCGLDIDRIEVGVHEEYGLPHKDAILMMNSYPEFFKVFIEKGNAEKLEYKGENFSQLLEDWGVEVERFTINDCETEEDIFLVKD